MLQLFKAELLRFRVWGIAAVLLHLGLALTVCRLLDPAQQPLPFYRSFAVAYGLAGLLLGLWQMGGYRRASAWQNLLHRPLAPWRIAAAVSGAAVVFLAVAIVLPLLAAAEYQAAFTVRVIDLRHWLLPVAAFLIAACGYLAGAYAMLANRRIAVTAIVFLYALFEIEADGWRVLVLQGVLLAWLAALLVTAFKPDLEALPRRFFATVITALPLQMTILLGFAVLALAGETAWAIQGSHPLAKPPAGGYVALRRMSANQRMMAGLGDERGVEAETLRRQIALSKVASLRPQVDGVVQRGRLTNDKPLVFVDGERQQLLVFSQDRMRLVRYRVRDGLRMGELGRGSDNAAFAVPVQSVGTLPGLHPGDQILLGGDTAFEYDSRTQRITPRIVLAAGETVFSVEPVGSQIAVLSNRAVYMFDSLPLVEGQAVMRPRQRVPLPCVFGDVSGVDLVEMADGYLFSFNCSAEAEEAHHARPAQWLLRVHDDGRVQTLVHRDLHQDFPALFRYRDWLPSPLLSSLANVARKALAPPVGYATTHVPAPASMRWLAAMLAMLSAIGAVWLGARRRLPWVPRLLWLVASAALSLPALIGFWLLYPKPDDVDAAADASSAS